ncbi:RHS repeat domain-containing protein [Flavobacterium sp.]|jgi:hypothetical protein|uniref:RHS repeat domain-containing protein n=1 Tax=Flavobacterium sp. TaxID=239 RepID=UPI0037BE5F04
MRKIYYLLILLFGFSVLSAQEKLSKEEKERREKNIQAGNPFAKYGCKAPVATLSKGKYLEVHDLDSIVTIGTSRWHVEYKKIVGDIVFDSLNVDIQPIGDAPGRWMSPDPLSEEFPEWSPYNMTYNNPVRYIDPDGMAPEDCCDGLKGFIVGTIDNIAGTRYRDNFNKTPAFNSGVRSADVVLITAGTFTTAKGIMDIGTGTAGLGTSLSVTAGTGGASIEVTGPTAVVSGGLILVGAAETYVGANITNNAVNNMSKDSSKETGSYTNTHESGTNYHGKGDKSRMNKSASEKAKANNDPVKSQDYTPAKNSREAFKQESRRLQNDGGAKSKTNYNKRDSPGTKYRKQDGEK